jgi:hypothetical protein
MLDITRLLEEIKASPYEEMVILAPHTGVLHFAELKEEARVTGPGGTWKERPGTLLATMVREHNERPITATQKGVVSEVRRELEGTFVEAGTPLVTLRHFLSKDEVLQRILRQALYLFSAPERAKYYFTPSVDLKVKVSGSRSVTVNEGMELFIVSRMKRETPLYYTGPEGVIYSVYFQHNENMDAGAPLIGVCPPDQLADIEDVVMRVQTEWEEQE